jgi:hypothetical protein
MENTVTLSVQDWQAALDFAARMASEIAEYDDQDEEYVAVRLALTSIKAQLEDQPDLAYFVPVVPPPAHR